VEANLRAAIARLQDAKDARELMDHEIAVSAALENMLAALGRPSETGVFGGMQGALATTELGVPAGASQVDACATPRSGPAFGTYQGYLAFVSMPLSPGNHPLPVILGATEVDVQDNVLVLKTPAAAQVAELCQARTAGVRPSTNPPLWRVADDAATGFNQPSGKQSVAALTGSGSSSAQQTDDAWPGFNRPPQARAAGAPSTSGAGNMPVLYTKAQAQAGMQVYREQCVSCHGTDLQGVAAPGVAGHEFLETAQRNDWSLEIIRTLVFDNMPFNSPGSLTPQQYADVMAFLLASNCFPAGDKSFPEKDQPSFSDIQLGAPATSPPNANNLGVCPVD
jgi:polar amino acid transport system substrate-binding protein